jgi:hypothetical protein
MTIDQFQEKILTSYRQKDLAANDVFRDDVSSFCNKLKHGADCQGIYDHIKKTHKSWDKPPMIHLFWEGAEKSGIIGTFQEKFRGFWHCKDCNTKYSFQSKLCPACGTTNSDLIKWDSDESYPSDVKMIQSNCGECSLYKPDKTGNGVRVYGCTCNDFGKYYLKTVDPICKDCACRPCCVLAAREKHDDKYEDDLRHGRIEEGWLL